MPQEEKGSDELLGAAAIDQERERVAKEEIALLSEEEITESADPLDDVDDGEFVDETPPNDQTHDEFDPLPPDSDVSF